MRPVLRGARALGPGPRRLTMESLESRKLLTVATLTYNSISDGSFEAPTLHDATYQLGQYVAWQFGTHRTRLPLPVRPGSSRASPA